MSYYPYSISVGGQYPSFVEELHLYIVAKQGPQPSDISLQQKGVKSLHLGS